MHYTIKIQGPLDETWTAWFEGLHISQDKTTPPIVTLTGPIVDQAALRGILNRVWDLNLTLISVNPTTTHEN